MAATEAAAAYHPWSERALRDTLGQPTRMGWVTSDSMGHLVASCVAGEGEILTLAVRPEARRRGLGSKLVEACLVFWRSRQVEQGFLEVRADNHGARALYARHGWSPHGTRTDYYGPGVDALVLTWRPK